VRVGGDGHGDFRRDNCGLSKVSGRFCNDLLEDLIDIFPCR
jgi:hypothetical protein